MDVRVWRGGIWISWIYWYHSHLAPVMLASWVAEKNLLSCLGWGVGSHQEPVERCRPTLSWNDFFLAQALGQLGVLSSLFLIPSPLSLLNLLPAELCCLLVP